MRLWPNTNSAPLARLSKEVNAWANLAPLTWMLIDWPVSLRTPAKARRSLSSFPTSKSRETPRDRSSVCEGVMLVVVPVQWQCWARREALPIGDCSRF